MDAGNSAAAAGHVRHHAWPMEGVEADCQAALADFRALGDKWGMAVVLTQLAEFAELRGDHTASIAVLEESASLGQELGAWGDLPYITGKLACPARAGDLTAARTKLERAERGDPSEAQPHRRGRWLGLMRAELHLREGDTAAAARVLRRGSSPGWTARRRPGGRGCARLSRPGWPWPCWRTVIMTGAGPCWRMRSGRRDWVERPPLADVIDAIAVVSSGPPSSPPPCSGRPTRSAALRRRQPGRSRGTGPPRVPAQRACLRRCLRARS